eukprot:21211-Eustigmatos_ZCMA.PRE.1
MTDHARDLSLKDGTCWSSVYGSGRTDPMHDASGIRAYQHVDRHGCCVDVHFKLGDIDCNEWMRCA